ncbi:MAG: signal peptidase I [Candidatus Eremiobacteraeota bacterium]|nr:signal peptidase I [Candidatus Eremiobacteraeota bacterium]MCW5870678.1 signal peptidase I [Candidatus Eremiobacteraeota bacterium]
MQDSGGGMILMMFYLVVLFFCAVMIAGLWRMFTKAGQPGWACLVPIYSNVVMARMAGLPIWTVLLLFVPFLGLFVGIYTFHRIFMAFGKSVLWTIGMFTPAAPFLILALGFGDAEYKGLDELGGGTGMSRF